MKHKYIGITLLAAVHAINMQALAVRQSPKLVVSITIEQLRTDYLEKFAYLYGVDGFKQLLEKGTVYTSGHIPFYPTDRASAIASISTGTSPYYNSIVGIEWLDRNTLKPTYCVNNDRYDCYSPANIATSTIGDELKIATNGNAIIYGIAQKPDAAILSAGHAADGAYWIDSSDHWCSSKYYNKKLPQWLDIYNKTDLSAINSTNDRVTEMALQCMNFNSMGRDDVTDMLFVTYDATGNNKEPKELNIQKTYTQLDYALGRLISNIEKTIGTGNVLFVISGTGYNEEPCTDYSKYKVPSGTFYINRTSNLLNMYLSAIYGRDQYIEGCFYNQIYLNIKLIDQKRLNISEILDRSQIFLMQNSGVQNVYTNESLMASEKYGSEKIRNGYNIFNCGDIIIETAPGWKLVNEDNRQEYISNINYTPFPIIFYGSGKAPQQIDEPVTIDRIAPSIAKVIQIRAPNACSSFPLF